LDVLLNAMEDVLNDLMVWVITEVSKNRTAADSSYYMHAWNATYTWLKAGVKYLENTAQAALKNSESKDANYLGAIAGSSVCVASVTGKELNKRQRYVTTNTWENAIKEQGCPYIGVQETGNAGEDLQYFIFGFNIAVLDIVVKSNCPSLLEKKGYESMMFSGCGVFQSCKGGGFGDTWLGFTAGMAIGNTMLACILEATKSEAALAAPIIQQGKAWFAGGVSMIGHLRTKLSVWNYTDGGGKIVAVDMPSNEVAFVNWKLPVAKKDADAGKGPFANWCHNSQYVSLSARVNLGVLIYDGDYYDLPQNGSDMSTTLLSSPWGYDVGGTALLRVALNLSHIPVVGKYLPNIAPITLAQADMLFTTGTNIAGLPAGLYLYAQTNVVAVLIDVAINIFQAIGPTLIDGVVGLIGYYPGINITKASTWIVDKLKSLKKQGDGFLGGQNSSIAVSMNLGWDGGLLNVVAFSYGFRLGWGPGGHWDGCIGHCAADRGSASVGALGTASARIENGTPQWPSLDDTLQKTTALVGGWTAHMTRVHNEFMAQEAWISRGLRRRSADHPRSEAEAQLIVEAHAKRAKAWVHAQSGSNSTTLPVTSHFEMLGDLQTMFLHWAFGDGTVFKIASAIVNGTELLVTEAYDIAGKFLAVVSAAKADIEDVASAIWNSSAVKATRAWLVQHADELEHSLLGVWAKMKDGVADVEKEGALVWHGAENVTASCLLGDGSDSCEAAVKGVMTDMFNDYTVPEGDKCEWQTIGSQCADGNLCINGVCTGPLGCGAACMWHDTGSECANHDDGVSCNDGMCSDGLCGRPVGYACTWSTVGTSCNSGLVCINDHCAEPLGCGAACMWHDTGSECANNDDGVSCNDGMCSDGLCGRPVGYACTWSTVGTSCNSGLVCINDQCAEPLGCGAACTWHDTGSECASGSSCDTGKGWISEHGGVTSGTCSCG